MPGTLHQLARANYTTVDEAERQFCKTGSSQGLELVHVVYGRSWAASER